MLFGEGTEHAGLLGSTNAVKVKRKKEVCVCVCHQFQPCVIFSHIRDSPCTLKCSRRQWVTLEENNYWVSCLEGAIMFRSIGRMTKYPDPSSSSFAEAKRRE